jgi:hypothetical protein
MERCKRIGSYLLVVLLTIGMSRPVWSQATTFSNATLQGGYAFHNLAWGINNNGKGSVAAPFAFTGIWTFDGNGSVSATDTLNDPTGSGVITNRKYTGTYSVNADGTGTISMTIAPGITVGYTLNIASNGNLVEVITTRPGIVSTFTLEKQ